MTTDATDDDNVRRWSARPGDWPPFTWGAMHVHNDTTTKETHTMTTDRCTATRRIHIGNQMPRHETCMAQSEHDGDHWCVTFDSDDNAITYRWND